MIHVRDIHGRVFDVEVDIAKDTASDVIKKLLNSHAITHDQQVRLVFRGRVIDDQATLATSGIEDGALVNIVYRPDSQRQAAHSIQIPQPPRHSQQPQQPQGSQQNLMEMARDMMQIPMFQQMVSNPDIVRNVMQMDPRTRRLLEEHPEMAEAISDPEMMRQMTEAAANPELAAEMARITDRSINNIESMPGGNALLGRILGNVDEDEEDEHSLASSGRRRVMRKGKTTSTGAAINPWGVQPPSRSGRGAGLSMGRKRYGGYNNGDAGVLFGESGDPRNIQRLSGPSPNPGPSSGRTPGSSGGMFPWQRVGSPPGPGSATPIPPALNFTPPGLPSRSPRSPSENSQSRSGHGSRSPTSVEDLRARFGQQLEIIRGMGFDDDERVLRLLELTGGNVQAVIGRLIGG